MRFFLLLSLMLSAFSAVAGPLVNETDYFNELKSLWDNGENLSLDKVSNKLFSGRCFDHEFPTTPRNSALIIYKYHYNYYHQVYKGNVLHLPGHRPSYFDIMTVRDLSKFNEIPLYKVASHNESTTIYFPNSGKHKLKQNGNYIISEYSTIDSEDDVGPIDEGHRLTTMRCYYFN